MHRKDRRLAPMTLVAVACWLSGPVVPNGQASTAAPSERIAAAETADLLGRRAPDTLPASQNAGGNDARREQWQRVPDILAAMGLAPGSVVADVGAGDGFFTTRLAKAVGASGRVLAVDISASALERLKARAAQEGLSNVEPVLGTVSDPKLPEGVLDAALIVNAYHEMSEHQAMLAAIKRALKPAGRLVILESVPDGQRGTPRDSQEKRHHLAPHYVQQDALAAGFVISRVEDPFTRRSGNTPEYMLVLTPGPAATEAGPDTHAHRSAGDPAERKPDEVVAALRLTPGMTVVDLGAGTGAFTGRLARAVGPSGRAIALEIEPASVEALRRDAAALGLANYEVRLVSADDPKLAPASVDVVFLSNVYHHIDNREAYFTRVRAAIKPGGRLAIVDFPPANGSGVPGHPDAKQVEAELARAGFRLVRTHTFLPSQFFLEFEPAR